MTEYNEINLDNNSENIIFQGNELQKINSTKDTAVNTHDVELLNINKKGKFNSWLKSFYIYYDSLINIIIYMKEYNKL